MNCPDCKQENDSDAVFCTQCGKPMEVPQQTARKQWKAYYVALLFVPVILIAAGIGYHRYFLPDGIAAVVNGDEIKLSELNAAVERIPGSAENGGRLRQQVLNGMIAERIVLQEALRAGVTVSDQEVGAVAAEARAASGMDEKAFDAEIRGRYGSFRLYQDELRRAMISRKFLESHVVPEGATAREAGLAVNQWVQARSGKATIRVALAEQGSGSGCGCCNKPAGPEKSTAQGARANADDPASRAAAAAREYWLQKHDAEAIDTKVTDFGCHMQIDMVRNGKVAASLRYQNGNISE